MDFEVKADLIPLFKGLVTGLVPYAQAQDVTLRFETELNCLMAYYNPQNVLAEITALLSRIITFTPQCYQVLVRVQPIEEIAGKYSLIVENTGVNLSKVGEIIGSVSSGLTIEELPRGTRFIIEIVAVNEIKTAPSRSADLLPKQYPQYYREIYKRLTQHFDKIENIQAAADAKGNFESIFMKKVNTVIKANLDNSKFSVTGLANAMALSRAQLFRKLKMLTQMSPSEYIRFSRLHEAKRRLQNKAFDGNVTEVGYSVGFSNVSHFTRSFKKQFGMTPSSLMV